MRGDKTLLTFCKGEAFAYNFTPWLIDCHDANASPQQKRFPISARANPDWFALPRNSSIQGREGNPHPASGKWQVASYLPLATCHLLPATEAIRMPP